MNSKSIQFARSRVELKAAITEELRPEALERVSKKHLPATEENVWAEVREILAECGIV